MKYPAIIIGYLLYSLRDTSLSATPSCLPGTSPLLKQIPDRIISTTASPLPVALYQHRSLCGASKSMVIFLASLARRQRQRPLALEHRRTRFHQHPRPASLLQAHARLEPQSPADRPPQRRRHRADQRRRRALRSRRARLEPDFVG